MNKIEKADHIFNISSFHYEEFLQNALSLSKQVKGVLFQGIGLRKGVNFMNCLHDHYTNEEVMELFESIETDNIKSNIVQDTMKIFNSINTSLIYHEFKKVNNNFSELNNEFSRLKLMEKYWLKENPKPSTLAIAANNVDYYPDGII